MMAKPIDPPTVGDLKRMLQDVEDSMPVLLEGRYGGLCDASQIQHVVVQLNYTPLWRQDMLVGPHVPVNEVAKEDRNPARQDLALVIGVKRQ